MSAILLKAMMLRKREGLGGTVLILQIFFPTSSSSAGSLILHWFRFDGMNQAAMVSDHLHDVLGTPGFLLNGIVLLASS